MKIAFAAIRFHTNEYEQVRAMIQRGITVDYYANISKHSENHSVLEPVVVGYSALSRLLVREENMLKYGLMPVSAIQNIIRSKPDLVMLKGFTLQSLMLKWMLSLCRIKSVVYVQRYIESATGKKAWIRNVLFGDEVMTAVKKCGPDAMEENKVGKQRWKFVPFVIRQIPEAEGRAYCPDGTVRFLTVGKFQDRKKLLEIVNVFGKKFGNDPAYQLTVVGSEYDAKYLQKLEEIVAIYSNVTLCKNVDHNEMGKIYAAHDVFIMGSVKEAASCSQLEAMAYGLAVLCCSDNGTASCVQSGENGYIYPPQDYEDTLAQYMDLIVENKGRLEQMGQTSVNLIRKNHSIENYLSYIDEVLLREGGR